MRALQEAVRDGTVIVKVNKGLRVPIDGILESYAVYSPCEQYRYALSRCWNPHGRLCAFIGLNPSTATEEINDPTVAKCIKASRRWGFGSMVMLNLFAFRATDPIQMKRQRDPVGHWNDAAIREYSKTAGRLVCCWGNLGLHRGRQAEVWPLVKDYVPTCLAVTKLGCPSHPLYLRIEDVTLWEPRGL